MSAETGLWILGTAVPMLLAWGIWLSWVARGARADTAELVAMHKEPDKHGFGTLNTNGFVRELTVAIQSLTHYIRWDIEDRTGKRPPPPL